MTGTKPEVPAVQRGGAAAASPSLPVPGRTPLRTRGERRRSGPVAAGAWPALPAIEGGDCPRMVERGGRRPSRVAPRVMARISRP